MSDFRAQVAAALEALSVTSPTSFAWFGVEEGRLPRRVSGSMSHDTARAYLAHTLEARLYTDFYCRGLALPAGEHLPYRDPGGEGALVEALSEANCGGGCWQPGWTVAGEDGSEVAVELDGLTLVASADDCRRDGSAARVRLPKEMLRASPGFYAALGDAAIEPGEPVLRVYWNLGTGGAVAFVAAGTRLFNDAGVAMRLKVANDSTRFDRCDAGVLYMRRADAERAWPLVGELFDALAPQLGPLTPALTKAVAPGVGVAEDPGGGGSYGTHRCGLIAAAVADAHERGAAATVADVEAGFAAAGLSVDVPFLGPGSRDAYPPLAADREELLRAVH